VQAHESDVGALAVNSEGTLIATASTKGTIIRIFSAEEATLLQELRRGSGKALITSIIFHPTLNMIACTSNRSSVHLFEIKKSIEKCIEGKQVGFQNGDQAKHPDGENKRSKLQFMSFLTKYFNSEWSATKIKVEEKLKAVGFDVKNHKLIIITHDRVLYYVDIPAEPQRYLDSAELRVFPSNYQVSPKKATGDE